MLMNLLTSLMLPKSPSTSAFGPTLDFIRLSSTRSVMLMPPMTEILTRIFLTNSPIQGLRAPRNRADVVMIAGSIRGRRSARSFEALAPGFRETSKQRTIWQVPPGYAWTTGRQEHGLSQHAASNGRRTRSISMFNPVDVVSRGPRLSMATLPARCQECWPTTIAKGNLRFLPPQPRIQRYMNYLLQN